MKLINDFLNFKVREVDEEENQIYRSRDHHSDGHDTS